MKGLGTRLLTAAVAIPILVYVVGWTPWYGFAGIAFLALGVTFHELFQMLMHDETKAMRNFAVFWGLLTLAALVLLWTPPKTFGFPVAPQTLPVLFVSMFGMFVVVLFARGRQPDLSPIPKQFTAMFFGVFFIAICGAHIIMLTRLPDGATTSRAGWVFLVLFCNFGSDTGGYFFGKLIGGPKLYPSVSPNKTWAGYVGCTVGATAGAFLIQYATLPLLTTTDCIVIGFLVATLGQLGDFFESLLKRAHNVKDAGSILPGHGGLLDRIDAMLVTGPVLFYYASWFVLT